MIIDAAHLVRFLRKRQRAVLAPNPRACEQDAHTWDDQARRLFSTIRTRKRDQIPEHSQLSPD